MWPLEGSSILIHGAEQSLSQETSSGLSGKNSQPHKDESEMSGWEKTHNSTAGTGHHVLGLQHSDAGVKA